MKAFLSNKEERWRCWSRASDIAIDEAKRILAETEEFPGSGLCYQGGLNKHAMTYHTQAAEAIAESLAAFVADDKDPRDLRGRPEGWIPLK